MQSPFAAGETLQFELMQGKTKVADLEIHEALLTQQAYGCVAILVVNHGSLSTRLEPGDCLGTVAPIVHCCSKVVYLMSLSLLPETLTMLTPLQTQKSSRMVTGERVKPCMHKFMKYPVH